MDPLNSLDFFDPPPVGWNTSESAGKDVLLFDACLSWQNRELKRIKELIAVPCIAVPNIRLLIFAVNRRKKLAR